MSTVRFDVPTMIAISTSWVNAKKNRRLLEAHPLTAGLVPILETVHTDLLNTTVVPSELAEKSKALSDEAARLDGLYDAGYRLLHSMLTATSLAYPENQRMPLENLVNTLLPEGAAGTRQSYLAESGAVELAFSRLTPEMEAILRNIAVANMTLYEVFNKWVDAGRRLGEVETERALLMDQKKDENRITGRDVQKARYRWIRAVNALESMLALESDISDADKARILQPLRRAEARFVKRNSGASDLQADETDIADDADTNDEVAAG
ncbi:MAG: hypothetical protein JXR76_25290 [Deltaproteobacteria bacterium]|nr:hypothetical protein [Deltaproteobacteria bacterium]